jgi:hypothetical protein
MSDDRDTGFTPENVFKAVLTLKEATEMGFARVEADIRASLSGVENRLGGKIDNLERRVARMDDRLIAIENQGLALKVADHESRITRLERRQ